MSDKLIRENAELRAELNELIEKYNALGRELATANSKLKGRGNSEAYERESAHNRVHGNGSW